jgi:hypothetical protein
VAFYFIVILFCFCFFFSFILRGEVVVSYLFVEGKFLWLLALSISTHLRINELPRISCGLLYFAIIQLFFPSFWLDNRAHPHNNMFMLMQHTQHKYPVL